MFLASDLFLTMEKKSDGRQKRSSIWMHFTAVSSEKAKCDICSATFSHKGGSTSNIKKYLTAKHPTSTVRMDEKMKCSQKVDDQRSISKEIINTGFCRFVYQKIINVSYR